MNFEEKVLSMLEGIQGQIDSVQSEQKQMRGQMSIMQGDVINMQSEMSSMYGDVSKTKDDMKSLRGALVIADKKIDAIQEEITDVRHSVAVIENDHGKKLGALCDNISLAHDLLGEVRELRETVDKLDFGREVLELLERVGYSQ